MSGEASRHDRSRLRRSTAVRTNSSTILSTSRRTGGVSLMGGGARTTRGGPGLTSSSGLRFGLGRNEISTAITAPMSSSTPSRASRRRRLYDER